MPYDYSSIMNAQRERIEAEHAQQRAELEAARLRDDPDGTMYAATRILELDAQMNALASRANQFASQQARPQGNAHGLSDTEVEIAKKSHSGGSVEDRVKSYAEQKHRLAYLRSTGQYNDTQGSVFGR